MDVFDLGSYARTSHTPRPSQEGRFDMLIFCLVMRGLSVMFSPLERGFKGCVTVRGAGWDEVFLLLLGEVVFLGFRWLL